MSGSHSIAKLKHFNVLLLPEPVDCVHALVSSGYPTFEGNQIPLHLYIHQAIYRIYSSII